MTIVTSKVTERSQTTLPPAVRTVLGLQPGERIGYVIEGSEVRLVNASALSQSDPVIDSFLAFLSSDMAENPDRLRVFPASLLERAKELAARVSVDHESPIEGAIPL